MRQMFPLKAVFPVTATRDPLFDKMFYLLVPFKCNAIGIYHIYFIYFVYLKTLQMRVFNNNGKLIRNILCKNKYKP